MIFNSLVFLVFLAVVLGLYYRLGHRAQNHLLVLASYVFYGWWDWRFLGLLLFTTFFDYWCALRLERETDAGKKKSFLAMSMAMNLTVLGFFKYFNFFADSLEKLFAVLGFHADMPTLQILLPVGISFYTFLSMSYTIDVYRGKLKATHNVLDFMLYVSFFPHLVAGPIVRAQDLLPQCARPRIIRTDQVVTGIWLCLLGYLKKVVIADRLAPMVDWGFASGQAPFPDATSWLVLYAFAFQIYGDFSGYSDIARGLAKVMGFELVHNFKAPYLTANPAAFWRHWHISLSVWLRDYLYIPLGGSRHGRFRTFRNLMLTMVLGGLWHGAGLAYVIWGTYHGVMLCVHRMWLGLRGAGTDAEAVAGGPGGWLPRAAHAVWVVVFFHLTCIGWLFFRAGSVRSDTGQWSIIHSYGANLWTLPTAWNGLAQPVILLGGLALVLQWQHAAMDQFARWDRRWQAGAVAAVLWAIASLGMFKGASFIYFQF